MPAARAPPARNDIQNFEERLDKDRFLRVAFGRRSIPTALGPPLYAVARGFAPCFREDVADRPAEASRA